MHTFAFFFSYLLLAPFPSIPFPGVRQSQTFRCRTASHVPLRPDSNIVMLRGAGFYGPKMLSQSVRPVFDESTGAWMVPDPHMPAKSNRHPFTAADLHSEIPTVSPSFWWGIVLLGMSGALSCMLTSRGSPLLPCRVVKVVWVFLQVYNGSAWHKLSLF